MKREKDIDNLLDILSKSAKSPQGKYSADESYGKLHERLFVKKKKRLPIYKYIAAASVAIIFVISAYVVSMVNGTDMITITTADNVKEITLPDGSHITLNHYSRLQYPSEFSKDSRNVTLVGEGFFDVAKDKRHPFIVQADGVEVKVLGTQFNVQSYSGDACIKTTLIEGKVSVNTAEGSEEIILFPNEMAVFDKKLGTIHKQEGSDAMNEIAWKEGKHIFNNKALAEIAQDLSNYFNVQIIVKGKSLQEYKLTAHFDQKENLDDILSILQTAVDFQIQKTDNTILITTNINKK